MNHDPELSILQSILLVDKVTDKTEAKQKIDSILLTDLIQLFTQIQQEKQNNFSLVVKVTFV